MSVVTARIVTNNEKAEMIGEAQLERPNDGLDEAVREKPGDPFSTRAPKYEHAKTETAKRIDEAEFALVLNCPSVTKCKYRPKTRVALDYIKVTR